MAQVTKDEVRNFTNVEDTDLISDSDLGDLIDVAADKVSTDTAGSEVTAKQQKRLELFYSGHLVKLKMRGASAIISDGDTDIEELDAEAGTIYSQMYQDEVPQAKGAQFGRVG